MMRTDVGRAAGTIAGWTLFSRLFGLVRDLVTARLFGDTVLGSAFMAAFIVPNVFRRLFGEGALSAAFLPVYTQSLAKGDTDGADRVASAVFASLAIVTGLILIVAELVLLVLLFVLPDSPERALSLKLIAITLPFMPAVCASAVLGGVLHAHGRFVPTAAAPVILNLLLIAAALPALLMPADRAPTAEQTAYLMAGAAVIAGVLQVAWALAALRGRLRWRRDVSLAKDQSKDVLRRFGPVALGMGTLQLNTLIDTFLAMVPVWIGPTVFGLTYPLDEASNGILGFTQRLYQFPLGVFGIAVATAAFPLLARFAAENKHTEFVRTLRDALRLSLFIGLPASVGLILVRHDLVSVLFGGPGSAFSEQGLARSAAVLLGYAPAVWIYGLNHVLSRSLYARGDTAGPTRAALASLALNLVLNLGLIWVLGEAGLAWSTAAASLFQFLLLARLVRKSMDGEQLVDAAVRRSVVRTALMTAAMALGVAASMWGVQAFAFTGWPNAGAGLAAAVFAGIGVYLVLAAALRAPELSMLIRRRVLPSEQGDSP